MSSAQGYASSAMSASRRGKSSGGEGKDPNIAAILAQGKKLADEQNVTGLEAVKDEFKSLGLGPTYQVLLKSARTPTPEQQRAQEEGKIVGDIFLRGIGINPPGTQPTIAPPTPREEAAQMSLVEPGPPAPTAQPKRQTGPRFRITSINRNADGTVSYTLNNKEEDIDRYLSGLQSLGKIDQESADELRATWYQLQLNDLLTDVKDIQSKTDTQTGQLYTHVIFKNGKSVVVPAFGPSLTPQADRISAYQSARMYAVYDKETDTYAYKSGATLKDAETAAPGRYMPITADVELAQRKAEARQRGGTRAANLETASALYDTNLPHITQLRNAVAAKGLLPSGGLKDINAFNQWINLRTSDPDMAELQGKVKLMADNLQRIFGSGQGGEWAFKLADTLLDPSLDPPAFQRRMESHGEDLRTLAKYYRSFGRNEPTPTPDRQSNINSEVDEFFQLNGLLP